MRFEPTFFDIEDGEDDTEPSLFDETKPWLVGVPLEKTSLDDQVVQCAGIFKDGSRCTRTYTQKSTASPAVSFCFKHRYQQRTSTHGYAPLAQADIQVLKRQPTAAKSCRCRCVHWTYQSMCAMFCLFLAIGLLFTSLIMEIPHIGLASAFFFCIPMVLLANCMVRMMVVAWLPAAPAQSHQHSTVQTA